MKFEIKKPTQKAELIAEKPQQIVLNEAKAPIKKKKIVKQVDPLQISDEQFNEVMKQLKNKKKPTEAPKEVEKTQIEPGRKKTDDGLAIYNADELKIGQKGSGNTKLCPFDCDCCY